MEGLLGLGVEREFDITDDWDVDIFGSISLGVSGGDAGTDGKSFIGFLKDGSFELVSNINLSADSELNLIEGDDVVSSSKGWLLELSGVDGSDEWNIDVFGTISDSVALGSTSSFLEFLIEFLSV